MLANCCKVKIQKVSSKNKPNLYVPSHNFGTAPKTCQRNIKYKYLICLMKISQFRILHDKFL